jgi:putative ABC transport system ATP-binding protein
MTIAPIAVEVERLVKVYGSGVAAFTALKEVDMQVRAGELVMIVGPSGSGKTTLLSILGCVLSPTSGSVRMFDKDISKVSQVEQARLRLAYIGFVFQGHNLIASLSAQDNVALLLEMRGYTRRAARQEALEMLARVGMAEKANSLPRDLSGGQRQRVAIARALAGRPPLILADEPTAALDAENGLKVTELLKQLASEFGHTVLVVTHDNRIFHLADRVLRIEDGVLWEDPR